MYGIYIPTRGPSTSLSRKIIYEICADDVGHSVRNFPSPRAETLMKNFEFSMKDLAKVLDSRLPSPAPIDFLFSSERKRGEPRVSGYRYVE